MGTKYTTQEAADVRRLYSAINSTPQDKQTIAEVAASIFVSGMEARDRLISTSTRTGT